MHIHTLHTSTRPCSGLAWRLCSARKTQRAPVCGRKWGVEAGGGINGGGGHLPPCSVFLSIFDSESIIFNLSAGICVTKADANSNKRTGEKKKREKAARAQQHNRSEKARANPCSDAIITHNQIRADLNRHRTQNHIKRNSMCMALHCSQSRLFPAAALLSLTLSLTSLLHFSLSSPLSVIITVAS